MRAAYIAVLFAACAALRGEYRQGAPMPPRPPAFNPGQDAPYVIGQPGYVGAPESLPRSPYTRVLPQTPKTRREAGVWAVDSGERHGLPYPRQTGTLTIGLSAALRVRQTGRCSDSPRRERSKKHPPARRRSESLERHQEVAAAPPPIERGP